ncbi:MAG: hypothetical protein KIS86_10570 [Devosia sp.]|nr:hypothetical protein [Devosia sp.]
MLMKRTLPAALFCAVSLPVLAQDIVWQQQVDVPIHDNLPEGIALDILGIASGHSPQQVKQALIAYAPVDMQPDDESATSNTVQGGDLADSYESALTSILGEMHAMNNPAPSKAPAFSENNATLTLRSGSGTPVSVSYLSTYKLDRVYGLENGSQGVHETISVEFSAPSSGQQVIHIQRDLSYNSQQDQPRISETVAALTSKIGAQPMPQRNGFAYLWQFDNGQHITDDAYAYACEEGRYRRDFTPESIAGINRDGWCDVYLLVSFRQGISQDHADTITFALYDNERIKTNIGADFAFFSDYVTRYRQQTGGSAPTL